MSTCARCGLEQGPNSETQCNSQQGWDQDEDSWAKLATIECRDRELANLRSLLRSVTGKLEEACEVLDGADRFASQQARGLIASVLEILS